MNRNSILALQSLASCYRDVEQMSAYFVAMSKDKRLSESLHDDCDQAVAGLSDCSLALENALEFVSSHDLPDYVDQNSH